ncbi:MAG: hypothetical protein ACXU85_01810 [Xanthobacteraceae bacterium]
MRSIRLFQDHHRHVDGKHVVHRAGETVDLPDDEAEFVVQSTLNNRAALREQAAATPGTFEHEHAGEQAQPEPDAPTL